MSTPDPATTDWVPVWSLGSTLADLRYNGAHVPGNAYTDGDIVFSGGVAYLCVRPTTATPAPWTVGIAPLPAVPRAKATRSNATLALPAAWTTIPWDAEEFDTDGIHDLVTNPQRLTCKTAGVYAWVCSTEMRNGTIGTNMAHNVYKNTDAQGGTVIGQTLSAQLAGIGQYLNSVGVLTLVPNDWISVGYWHNGTGSWTLTQGSFFSMWRIA